jgi:hypothetical protein
MTAGAATTSAAWAAGRSAARTPAGEILTSLAASAPDRPLVMSWIGLLLNVGTDDERDPAAGGDQAPEWDSWPCPKVLRPWRASPDWNPL